MNILSILALFLAPLCHAQELAYLDEPLQKFSKASRSAPPATTGRTTTQPPTTVASSPPSTESIREVTSDDILGCNWPEDYEARVNFCLKKANLSLFESNSGFSPVKYGLLDASFVKTIEKSCIAGSICPGKYDQKKLTGFTEYWKANSDKIARFETCLRMNTEGIVKMCGTTSEVGKVISGAAGLHLNLMGALQKLKEADEQCFLKASEAAHLTAALYMHEDAYQQNNVMCWDTKDKKAGCTADCAKFSSELFCLSSACQNVTQTTFKSIGIWDWYFSSKDIVNKRCEVSPDICKSANQPQLFGRNTTFAEKVKQKWNILSSNVENTLHLPIFVVLAIAAGSLLLVGIITTVLCMYLNGTLFKRRRTLRYSSLINEAKADEMRKLADQDDDDD